MRPGLPPHLGYAMTWSDMATPFVETLIGVEPEWVQYIPRADSGNIPRMVRAVVDREPEQGFGGVPGGTAPGMVIVVRNDPLNGIASSEIDTGGDKIAVAARYGREPEEREIGQIVRHDSAVVVVEVR